MINNIILIIFLQSYLTSFGVRHSSTIYILILASRTSVPNICDFFKEAAEPKVPSD
jgi:hypothetical protein